MTRPDDVDELLDDIFDAAFVLDCYGGEELLVAETELRDALRQLEVALKTVRERENGETG